MQQLALESCIVVQSQGKCWKSKEQIFRCCARGSEVLCTSKHDTPRAHSLQQVRTIAGRGALLADVVDVNACAAAAERTHADLRVHARASTREQSRKLQKEGSSFVACWQDRFQHGHMRLVCAACCSSRRNDRISAGAAAILRVARCSSFLHHCRAQLHKLHVRGNATSTASKSHAITKNLAAKEKKSR